MWEYESANVHKGGDFSEYASMHFSANKQTDNRVFTDCFRSIKNVQFTIYYITDERY